MPYAEAQQFDGSVIPVIDLAGIETDERVIQANGRAMLQAAETVGFFYIRNHGIPAELIASVLRVSAAFFAEPLERKQTVTVNSGHRGWIGTGQATMTGSKRPDLKESFVWGLDESGPDGIPPNRWPDFKPEMRTVLTSFFDAGNRVGWSLLRAFAAALDAPRDCFVRTIARPISRGSIIYYPPQPSDRSAAPNWIWVDVARRSRPRRARADGSRPMVTPCCVARPDLSRSTPWCSPESDMTQEPTWPRSRS